MRETAITDERRAREREVRILREALHPFYKSEEEMRRKLVEIEDRIEGNYDEQLRLKDRVMALDDANMALEKRLEDAEGYKAKRRRISRPVVNGTTSDIRPDDNGRSSAQSSPRDFTLTKAAFSGTLSPQRPASSEREEPRSSGILNLVNVSEPPPYFPQAMVPTPRNEVRSSGFLEIPLSDRLASKFSANQAKDIAPSTMPVQKRASNSLYDQHIPVSVVSMLMSSQIAGRDKATAMTVKEVLPSHRPFEISEHNGELRPLDVLANLSVASSLVR